MAAALIGSAQAAFIHDSFASEAHRVFERGAANQSHVAHLVEIGFPSEGAGERDFRRVAIGSDFQFDGLPADRRGIVRVAGEAEALGGKDADTLSLVLDGDGAANTKIAALPSILADAGFLNQSHEG